MMAQEEFENTWEPDKYRKFISQFQPDIITYVQRFERMEIKVSRQRMSIIFNQKFLNEKNAT